MSTQLIALIDLEIGKLTAAREALVGPDQPPVVAREPITAATLLSGVNINEISRNLHDSHRRPQPMKKKGGMSQEGRAAVAAAQKARWAKKKAEEKKARKVA